MKPKLIISGVLLVILLGVGSWQYFRKDIVTQHGDTIVKSKQRDITPKYPSAHFLTPKDILSLPREISSMDYVFRRFGMPVYDNYPRYQKEGGGQYLFLFAPTTGTPAKTDSNMLVVIEMDEGTQDISKGRIVYPTGITKTAATTILDHK